MGKKLLSLILVMVLCLSNLTVSAASTKDCSVEGHTWGSWKTLSKATCTVNGLKQHTCRVCKLVEEKVIEKTGHKYKSKWTKITKKNLPCADMDVLEGGKFTTCTKCKDIKVKNKNGKEISKDSKAFNHVAKTITKTLRKANCSGGVVKITCCKKCKNITKVDVGNKKSHKYGKLSLGKQATCKANGYYFKSCKNCGHQQIHNQNSSSLNSKQLSMITAKGHNPGQYELVSSATCTANAKYVQRCSLCREVISTGEGGQTKTWKNRNGKSYTVTLDGKAKGHNWIDVYNDDGSANGQICTHCGTHK